MIKIKGISIIAIIFLGTVTHSWSATLKGRVLDSKSKEGLIGAIIYIKDNDRINATAGLDGSFVIKHLGKGTYTFVAKFFGYTTLEKSVTIADSSETQVQDFLMDAEMMNLGQVQVTSNYQKGTDNYARNEEKNADYVMNVVSAKTIELSPDITVADVLQRVSGVMPDRSVTGGSKFANIRGMDATYNNTSIDGVLIPSPDYKTRSVPMDLFPSDIIERLEVYKTLTPDKEADFIGGGMNLVLKDAPSKFSLSAEVATGYNQSLFNHGYNTFDASVINPKTPNEINGANYISQNSDFPTANLTYKDVSATPSIFGGFTIGDRFLHNKLGVLASVSYQNQSSLTYGMFIKPQSEPFYLPVPNMPQWDHIQSNSYSLQQIRAATHIRFDYEFNPRHSMSLYAIYTEINEQRMRYEQDTLNSLPGSEINPDYESKVTYRHIFNTTLKGNDSLGRHLLLDWTGAFSTAGSNVPDWDDLSLTAATFSSLSRTWMQNTDNTYSGYLNLSYFTKLWGQDVLFKVGGMDRYETRDAFYAEYDWNAVLPQPAFTNIADIYADSNYYKWLNRTGSPQSKNSYNVQENVSAFYGMAKFSIGPRIDVVGGLRVENTSFAYQDDEPNTVIGQSETKTYTDILPSVEVKFKLTPKQAIRVNYFASITRPSFYDVIPYDLSDDLFSKWGNPLLEHAQANNYDLRYEFFMNSSDELLAGVFLKQIYNPIELAIRRGDGPSATVEQPINVGGDTNPVINYGFELQAIKYLGAHFGISANYTYTHSSITVNELIYRATEGTGNPKNFDTTETRPLQGQAAHIANLSLIYKEPKIGLQVQVSGVYTGKFIHDVSSYYQMDIWQMPMIRLDFSFEKKLSKKYKLSLYGKVNNILNTPVVLRMFPPVPYPNTPQSKYFLPNQDSDGNISSIVVQKEYFGQTYLIGFRYKF